MAINKNVETSGTKIVVNCNKNAARSDETVIKPSNWNRLPMNKYVPNSMPPFRMRFVVAAVAVVGTIVVPGVGGGGGGGGSIPEDFGIAVNVGGLEKNRMDDSLLDSRGMSSSSSGVGDGISIVVSFTIPLLVFVKVVALSTKIAVV